MCTREAADDVRGQGEVGDGGEEQVGDRTKVGARVLASHALEHSVGARLPPHARRGCEGPMQRRSEWRV